MLPDAFEFIFIFMNNNLVTIKIKYEEHFGQR
jgi:hypothetical protein